jgi:hypothetical protein
MTAELKVVLWFIVISIALAFLLNPSWTESRALPANAGAEGVTGQVVTGLDSPAPQQEKPVAAYTPVVLSDEAWERIHNAEHAPKPVDPQPVDPRVAAYPDWPWAEIDRHEILLGMTANMVRLSLGPPGHINKSVGSWGVHEQWVYEGPGSGSYGYDYLYFENGIVTSWDQSE